jgi:hypothetical protein
MGVQIILKHHQVTTNPVYIMFWDGSTGSARVYNWPAGLWQTFNIANINSYALPMSSAGGVGLWSMGCPIKNAGTFHAKFYEGTASIDYPNNLIGEQLLHWMGDSSARGPGHAIPAAIHAHIEFIHDSGTGFDKWRAIWYLNGEKVNVIIPSITLYDRDTGATLLSMAAMTEIGGQSIYEYNDNVTVQTQGQPIVATVQAGFNGKIQTFSQTFGLGDELGSGGSYI